MEIQLKDVNLGFMISPLAIILQLKGLTIYTPNISEEEAKTPADRVTLHVPELKIWLERTPCSKHCSAALTIEAIGSSINYVYLQHFSTETNFDRVIKTLDKNDGTEIPRDMDVKESMEEVDPDDPAAAATDIGEAFEAMGEAEEREEEERGGRKLVSVRKILLQAPTRVYVRGGGVPLMVPLSLGSVLIDPAKLRGHPAAFFVWINQRILIAIANSGVELVSGVGKFALNAVGAGATAVMGGGAAVCDAAGDGVRSVISGAENAFSGLSSSGGADADADANEDADPNANEDDDADDNAAAADANANDANGDNAAAANADADGGKEKGNPLMRGLRSTGRFFLQGIGNSNRAMSRVFNCNNENETEEERDPADSRAQQR